MRSCCAATFLLLTLAACSPDSIGGTPALPAGLSDPNAMNTPRGAVIVYRGTRQLFGIAFSDYVVAAGLITDELQPNSVGAPPGPSPSRPLDARELPQGVGAESDPVYGELSKVRGQAQQAIGLLARFAPDSVSLRAYVYTLDGYAELMLNELFCSGVPLSTLDYSGDFTYRPASSTDSVYEHAIAMFDSAATSSGDSTQILNLARVGKARALLGLGKFAEATQIAATVPDGFSFEVVYPKANNSTTGLGDPQFGLTVSDREGINGLDYRSSGDPRTATIRSGVNTYGLPLYHAEKYGSDGLSPILLADWIEARLIQAEGALHAAPNDTTSQGTGWLGMLNHLRETGISPGLPDTTDPGTFDARVNLLYRERAFWLFLTGHRQGDMRRLVRQHNRNQNWVYPTGPYDAGGSYYGTDVTAPIPSAERKYNPVFMGCLNRGA